MFKLSLYPLVYELGSNHTLIKAEVNAVMLKYTNCDKAKYFCGFLRSGRRFQLVPDQGQLPVNTWGPFLHDLFNNIRPVPNCMS